MHHIHTTNLLPNEVASQIGGQPNIDPAFYPVCPITQQPMLLLLTLRKDIFDSGYAFNNKLEEANFCVSVFVSAKVHPQHGVGNGMPGMYTINQLSECNKMTNGTVKVLLHKDTQTPVTLPDAPIPIPAQKLSLTKATAAEEEADWPPHREWYEGSVLQVSKFGAQFEAWLQDPINFDKDIIVNYTTKVFKPAFGPHFTLQIEDALLTKHSPLHSGILGTDGMGYLYLPSVLRNWVKKYTQPIEIGNFFVQNT